MAEFTGVEYCNKDISSSEYEGAFTHDMGELETYVVNNLITTLDVAIERATVELIKGAYIEQTIFVETLFIANLKQNDIIKVNEKNWVVREINIKYKSPKLIYNIIGVRYE